MHPRRGQLARPDFPALPSAGNRLRHYTTCGNNRSATDHDVGKNNCTRADKCLSLDPNTAKLLEVRNNSGAHTDCYAILDGNQVRTCSIENHIVSDPHIFSDFHPASAVEHYAQGLCSWHTSGQ